MSAYLKTTLESLYVKDAFEYPEDCRLQGQAAGDQAYPIDQNPYPPNTARHEFWREGHLSSLDELTGTP